MSMEGPPAAPEQPKRIEREPNPWESVEAYIGLTPEEKDICVTCTHEHREHLIDWYVQEQDKARTMPTSREGILLDIKAGCMQYVIAKDMEQRGEAIERLIQARDTAIGDGMPDLVERANIVIDMLEAV